MSVIELNPTKQQPEGISNEEKVWATITHVGSVFVSVLVPIVVLVVKGRESDWVRRHAIEALNFHIGMLLIALVSYIAMFFLVGLCGLIAVAFGVPILAIIASVKAWHGHLWRYPFTLRLIKE